MRHIKRIDEYFVNLDLDDSKKLKIREFVEKYEKYLNMFNREEFPGSLEDIVSTVMKKVEIPEDKRDATREYIHTLYDLSDDLSVIMSPYPEFAYVNNQDQVQKLQY